MRERSATVEMMVAEGDDSSEDDGPVVTLKSQVKGDVDGVEKVTRVLGDDEDMDDLVEDFEMSD